MRAFGIAMVHAFIKSTGGAGVRPPPTPTAAPSPPRVDRLRVRTAKDTFPAYQALSLSKHSSGGSGP